MVSPVIWLLLAHITGSVYNLKIESLPEYQRLSDTACIESEKMRTWCQPLKYLSLLSFLFSVVALAGLLAAVDLAAFLLAGGCFFNVSVDAMSLVIFFFWPESRFTRSVSFGRLMALSGG